MLLSIAGVSSAQNTTVATVNRIESYLEKLEKIGYSGSVLVAINGKPLVSRGYGFSDREQKIKSSPQTISDIGSRVR